MSDTLVLQISEKWGICTDGLQWVLSKAEKQARDGDLSAPAQRWRAIAYIAGRKDTLLRVAREKSAPISPEAWQIIEGWPDTYREWCAQRGERRAA